MSRSDKRHGRNLYVSLLFAANRALTSMGAAPSKSEGCMAALCWRRDDAYVGSECPFEETQEIGRKDERPVSLARIEPHIEDSIGRRIELEALVRSGEQPQSPACLPRESLCSVHEMAPSTGEELPLASAGCGIDENGGKTNFSSVWSEPWASTPPSEDFLTPSGVEGHTHNSLMRESPEAEMGEGAAEGLKTFFRSGRDEFLEDTSWSHTKHGPSLAGLLQRIESLGNVDEAMSQVRSLQDTEDKSEAIIRAKVIQRFLRVMGPAAPGLAVKKCHRGSGGGNSNGAERGKWAARTISFELNGADSLPDGTPLGGSIVWNSKRLFPREQPGIRIIDIARVEHSDQFLWMIGDGQGRLGFEMHSSADARFLCRSIDFLVSAVVQHTNIGRSRSSTKTSSLQSIGTNQHVYPPPLETWPQGPQALQGPQGSQGPQGYQGPQGSQGSQRAQGAQGA